MVCILIHLNGWNNYFICKMKTFLFTLIDRLHQIKYKSNGINKFLRFSFFLFYVIARSCNPMKNNVQDI
jgi:hypothetical protein